MFEKKTILLISPEPWGVNFVSKHHYAKELAMNGNMVYFLNPPNAELQQKVVVEKPFDSLALRVISYRPSVRGLNRLPGFLADRFNARTIQSIYSGICCNLPDVVWSFDPYRFQNLKLFNAKLAIYHIADLHATDQELRVARTADLLLSVSRMFLDKFKMVDVRKEVIGHGLASHWLSEAPPPNGVDLPGDYKVKVGYVGNLSHTKVDTQTIEKIVRNNPEVGFYFIGPTQKSNLSSSNHNAPFFEQLAKAPNVHMLGILPSGELPRHLNLFDMFLIAYDSAGENRKAVSNTHKMLEYLATGKPVVTCYIDEYRNRRTLVNMAKKDNSNLVKLFEETVANLEHYNTPKQQQQRRDYALGNSYPRQLERIEGFSMPILKEQKAQV